MKKNAEAKNLLESYIYVVNDVKEDEDFLKYVREHELKKLISLAEEVIYLHFFILINNK